MATRKLPRRTVEELDTAHSYLRAIMDRECMMGAEDIEDLLAAAEIVAKVLSENDRPLQSLR